MDREFLMGLLGNAEAVEAVLQAHQQVVQGYEQQLRTQAVEAAVGQAVTAAGGRNLRAIRALLDEQQLAGQPDVQAAAAEAVERLQQQEPYLFAPRGFGPQGGQLFGPQGGQLFGTGQGIAPGVPGRALTQQELARMTPEEYRRYRKGL